jgi:hypothetical protein
MNLATGVANRSLLGTIPIFSRELTSIGRRPKEGPLRLTPSEVPLILTLYYGKGRAPLRWPLAGNGPHSEVHVTLRERRPPEVNPESKEDPLRQTFLI